MPRRKNRKMGENQEVQKNQKIKLRVETERNYMIVKIFCLLSRQSQKQHKKLEDQVFLVRLLALLSFASLPHFRLLETSALGLTVGLTIGKAEFISR